MCAINATGKRGGKCFRTLDRGRFTAQNDGPNGEWSFGDLVCGADCCKKAAGHAQQSRAQPKESAAPKAPPAPKVAAWMAPAQKKAAAPKASQPPAATAAAAKAPADSSCSKAGAAERQSMEFDDWLNACRKSESLVCDDIHKIEGVNLAQGMEPLYLVRGEFSDCDASPAVVREGTAWITGVALFSAPEEVGEVGEDDDDIDDVLERAERIKAGIETFAAKFLAEVRLGVAVLDGKLEKAAAAAKARNRSGGSGGGATSGGSKGDGGKRSSGATSGGNSKGGGRGATSGGGATSGSSGGMARGKPPMAETAPARASSRKRAAESPSGPAAKRACGAESTPGSATRRTRSGADGDPLKGKPIVGFRGKTVVTVKDPYYHNGQACWTFMVVWENGNETCERVDNFVHRELINRSGWPG